MKLAKKSGNKDEAFDYEIKIDELKQKITQSRVGADQAWPSRVGAVELKQSEPWLKQSES